MQDINIVSLVGRLTSDPELRSLASGTSVCQMRIAFNTSKRAASGEWEDVGNFVNVTVWGNHGETCAKHLSRGKRVALQGRLQWREWEGQNGKQNAIEIVADRVQFIEPRDSSSDSNQRSTAPRQSAPAPTEDDDVPF